MSLGWRRSRIVVWVSISGVWHTRGMLPLSRRHTRGMLPLRRRSEWQADTWPWPNTDNGVIDRQGAWVDLVRGGHCVRVGCGSIVERID